MRPSTPDELREQASRGAKGRRVDLLRDVGHGQALSRQLRHMRRQLDAVTRGGPIAAAESGTAIPFTRPDQVVVSGAGGKPTVVTLPAHSVALRGSGRTGAVEVDEGEMVGRPTGGDLGATTVGAMGGLLRDGTNPKKRTETGNYTAALTDFLVMMDLTAGSKTLTLPLNPGATYDGKLYIVGDPDDTWTPSTNVLTIARGGVGDTINGFAGNVSVQSTGACVLLQWNQTPRNWNAWVWSALP